MTDDMRAAQSLPLLSNSDLSLDLVRQKRLAKELRDTVRDGCSVSISRLQRHHPRFNMLDLAALKLSDAQLTLAREAGLSSWSALKKHAGQMEAARMAIESGRKAPDADLPTLHIRCGNDIEAALERAGFNGEFLMFADPICQGPVTSGDDYLEQRASFIASEYAGETFEASLKGLKDAETRLSKAYKYGRIVLWFEHDSYDQLSLAKVLTVLHATGADQRKVELVSLDRFPGIKKFIGIGQLSPAALRHMYQQRKTVPSGAFSAASEIWRALSATSPLPLSDLVERSEALPYAAAAIKRYLAELPSLENGLSYTEHMILDILRDGPLPVGEIFRKFLLERDFLPYHGDLMFLGTLNRLRNAGTPALNSSPTGSDRRVWSKAVFSLTQTGYDLLDLKKDWKFCKPQDRVHGGTVCFAAPDWRWHKKRDKPVVHPG